MSPFTEPTLSPSITRWQSERDALLDQISYLENKVNRTGDFLMKLLETEDEQVQFDLTEALMILFETKIDSEARRFAPGRTPVLVSTGTNTKEDES